MMPKEKRIGRLGLGLLLALAVVAVLWVPRFQGLGERPLARDEYYSAAAVQQILAHGVPELHGGGYYLRALPLHYLTAGLCLQFGANEETFRILPALFGLLAIPLAFLFARHFVPVPVALGLAAVLCLSSWETEFSRFGRMYTTLQFVTLAFFIAYYLAFHEGRRKWTYVPHILAALAVTIQSLGVFLLPLLLVAPFIRPADSAPPFRRKETWKLCGAGLAALVFGFVWYKLVGAAFSFGVVNPLPLGVVAPHSPIIRALNAAYAFPALTPFQALVGFALTITGTTFLILLRWRSNLHEAVVPVALGVVFAATAFHQFTPAALSVAFLIWRYDLHRVIWKTPRLAIVLGIAAAPAVFWVGYAAAHLGWIYAIDPHKPLRAIRLFFFGSPGLYEPFISVWLHTAPLLTTIIAAGTIYELWRIRQLPWRELVWHPVWVIAYLAVCFGIFNSLEVSTRYWFFVYPLMLLLPAMAITHALKSFFPRFRWLPVGWASALLLILAFLTTRDFQPRELFSPNAPDIVFRTGPFERFSNFWYPRDDERSPALALNRLATSKTMIILSGWMTVMPYYLAPDLDPVMFMAPEADDRFYGHSRDRGTLDEWSGYRLASNLKALRRYTRNVSDILIARRVAAGPEDEALTPKIVWPHRLVSSKRVFLSQDSRVEILHVKLTPVRELPVSPVTFHFGSRAGPRVWRWLAGVRDGPRLGSSPPNLYWRQTQKCRLSGSRELYLERHV